MSAEPERGDDEKPSSELPTESADAAEIAAADVGETDDPLTALQTKADDNWEKYVRAAAELENVRKRAVRDVEQAHKFSLERFARELLAVRDSLELGLDMGADAGSEALLKGSQATLKLLCTTMERFGIDEVDPHGEPFNPELHEAMAMQPSNDIEPGSVLTVFQKGYTLNNRLLRPARVVVAQEPAENSSED